MSESTFREGDNSARNAERPVVFGPLSNSRDGNIIVSDPYVTNEPHNISGMKQPSFLDMTGNKPKNSSGIQDQLQMPSSGGQLLFDRGERSFQQGSNRQAMHNQLQLVNQIDIVPSQALLNDISNDISNIEHRISAGFFHEDDELNENNGNKAAQAPTPAPFLPEAGGQGFIEEENIQLVINKN